MQLRPVIDDPTVVVEAVTRAAGRQVVLVGALDVDVFRVRPIGGGSDVVVRAFGSAVPAESVHAVVRVLCDLGETRFPAERCATGTPVVPLGDGRHLLLTGYVESSPSPRPGFLLAWCAALLGRLATLSPDGLPLGGGWHRLGATPAAELDAATQLAASFGPVAAPLLDALVEADDATGLPAALIHPDLVPANALPRGEDPPVIVDWIDVGRGPRAWSLAFLLYAAGPRLAARSLERWCRSAELTGEERQRLPGIMLARPVALDVWSVAYERMTTLEAVKRLQRHRSNITAITAALDHG